MATVKLPSEVAVAARTPSLAQQKIDQMQPKDLEAWLNTIPPKSVAVKHQSISMLKQVGRIADVPFPAAQALQSGRNKAMKEKSQVVG